MHSFRIIVKTPDHLVGHNDAMPQRSGWIEWTEGQWLIVIIDPSSDVRLDYRRSSLIDAITILALKLSGVEG